MIYTLYGHNAKFLHINFNFKLDIKYIKYKLSMGMENVITVGGTSIEHFFLNYPDCSLHDHNCQPQEIDKSVIKELSYESQKKNAAKLKTSSICTIRHDWKKIWKRKDLIWTKRYHLHPKTLGTSQRTLSCVVAINLFCVWQKSWQ